MASLHLFLSTLRLRLTAGCIPTTTVQKLPCSGRSGLFFDLQVKTKSACGISSARVLLLCDVEVRIDNTSNDVFYFLLHKSSSVYENMFLFKYSIAETFYFYITY